MLFSTLVIYSLPAEPTPMFAELSNEELFFTEQFDVSGTNGVPDPNDTTEGITAFLDILSTLGPKNLDLGGGKYDDNSKFLKSRGIENYVADLFGRSKDHNLKALSSGPFDSITSMSVLNVIDNDENRLKHIVLTHRLLKPGKCAYFKIYEGNKSGIPKQQDKSHQENKLTADYVPIISNVYSHVESDQDRFLIIACKEKDES